MTPPGRGGATVRQARERALELVFEAEAKGVHPAAVVASFPVAPDPFAASLAEGVGDHLPLLDRLIGARAKGWSVARMPAVDRALLRLGAFELAYEPEQPIAVVVSEAVELARTFSTDDSPRFVNGVLSKIADDVRGDGPWGRLAAPLRVRVAEDVAAYVHGAAAVLDAADAHGVVEVARGGDAEAGELVVVSSDETAGAALDAGAGVAVVVDAERLAAVLRRVGALPATA